MELKQNRNYLPIKDKATGIDRKVEMINEIFDYSSLLPKTLTYKDIDSSFKKWVEEELSITSDDGKAFPTMSLFSNQRFSEYTQSWKYTDENNNLLLNFKTVSRENNPEYGKIHGQLYNIPGKDRFFTFGKKVVLDNNGSESLLVFKTRQPTSIDFRYKVSVFTTKYDKLNEFNTLVNKAFNARQSYIKPNGHYIPMIIENISDESSYSLDDRQFYGQTYIIKAMGYIITKDDYRIEEHPLKYGLNVPQMPILKNAIGVDIEEYEDCEAIKYKCYMPKKSNKSTISFTNDTKCKISDIKKNNVRDNYRIFINGEVIEKQLINGVILNADDEIKINFTRLNPKKDSTFNIVGIKIK